MAAQSRSTDQPLDATDVPGERPDRNGLPLLVQVVLEVAVEAGTFGSLFLFVQCTTYHVRVRVRVLAAGLRNRARGLGAFGLGVSY